MILIDPLRTVTPRGGWRFTLSAHMVSDSSFEELHKFAERIGLRREWFQGDHYDLTERRHAMALREGALVVSTREIVRRRVRSKGIAEVTE